MLTLARGSGVTTEMFCTAPGVMQVESTYLHNLENSTTIRFRSDHLYLYDSETNRSSSLNRQQPENGYRS